MWPVAAVLRRGQGRGAARRGCGSGLGYNETKPNSSTRSSILQWCPLRCRGEWRSFRCIFDRWVSSTMVKKRSAYGPREAGVADTVAICKKYSEKAGYYDALGFREKTTPTTSGLRYAFKALHKKHPLATYSRVRDWWRKGTWHKPHADVRSGTSLLCPSQERVLAHFAIMSAAAGKAMRVSEIKRRAAQIAEKNGIKIKKGSRMRKWFEGWLANVNKYASENKMGLHNGVSLTAGTNSRITHNGKPVPALKIRHKGRALSNARARALNPESISSFEKNCVTPFLEWMATRGGTEVTFEMVANFDEWMFDCQESLSQRMVCAPPGNMFNRVPKERADHVTVLSGHVGPWATPILIIFASTMCANGPEYLSVWQKELEERPEMSGYVLVAVSENGWVTADLKRRWFKYVTSHKDFPDKDKPKLWVCDGHYTNHDRRLWNYALGKRFAFNIDGDAEAAEALDNLMFDGDSDEELGNEEPDADEAGEWGNSDVRAATAGPAPYSHRRPAGLGQQLLCILPSHMTHGLQQMDCGMIRATKRNLGTIMDQFHDSTEREEALGRADMVYGIAMAVFGGKMKGSYGKQVATKGGGRRTRGAAKGECGGFAAESSVMKTKTTARRR